MKRLFWLIALITLAHSAFADTSADLKRYTALSAKASALTRANPFADSKPVKLSEPVYPQKTDKRRSAPAPRRNASDVFGTVLFSGQFSKDSFTGFNPNHIIGIGDQIALKIWGAQELETTLTVDAQGNIFIPHVGPVQVLGIRNSDLDAVVKDALATIYRSNVNAYVNLAAAQPVKIYVTGFVKRPGMYQGVSSDSVLNFLDQAGGIDPDRGSFIDITIKRGEQVVTTINLYHFLLAGEMPSIQFQDGDTIIAGARKSTVRVSGLVQNSNTFEFRDRKVPLSRILNLARVQPRATHVRIIRNSGMKRNVDYYAIEDAHNIMLMNGDEVLVTADKKPGTITVRVEGEHDSPQEYILPYGAKLGDLLDKIQLNDQSDIASVQLFRKSVKERQKEMLLASLQSLQSAVLTARSATNEEAALRGREAELALKWIEKAKTIEPKGQVVLSHSAHTRDVVLENGDIINIPSKSSMVMVHGEVLFPNVVVYRDKARLKDYIQQAGGYTQSANTSLVVVLHRDGSFERAKAKGWPKRLDAKVVAGDEILVLPKVDFKRLQITKDVSQVIYQIALSAAVVLAL
ncbi:MAG TPA: polysialic acid transporter [Gammaproteobacteria bacterium]|nr:polysialic acid transporter [Gammaproteobacteria bacterium]